MRHIIFAVFKTSPGKTHYEQQQTVLRPNIYTLNNYHVLSSCYCLYCHTEYRTLLLFISSLAPVK